MVGLRVTAVRHFWRRLGLSLCRQGAGPVVFVFVPGVLVAGDGELSGALGRTMGRGLVDIVGLLLGGND